MLVAISAIVDARAALATLLETQSLDDGVSHILKLRLDDESVEPDKIAKSMKLQIGNIYFHALETLVRLFLAHGPDTRDSPWFALARETDFKKFKRSKVLKLAKVTSDWTGEAQEDAFFRHVLAPVKGDPDEPTRAALSRAKQWVAFASKELLDAASYNAFKHGLAVPGGEELVAVYSKEEDPRINPDGESFLSAKSDALVVLERQRQTDGSFNWFRRMRYLKMNERIGVIWSAHRMLQTILTIGEGRFVTGKVEGEIWLPPYDPQQMISATRKDGISMEGLTMGLGFSDPPAPRQGKKRKRGRR